jgi:predicted nucleotidyltransferase
MLIEPILGYKSTFRILSLLFETPRKLVSRRELFEFTNLGNAPLSKGLSRLVKADIIFLKKKGKKEFYYVNIDNNYTKLLRGLWESEKKDLRQLDYDVKIIVSEFIRQLLDVSNAKKVILFGSWAKGIASIRSDVDLAVIFDDKIKSEMEITRFVKKLEQRFNKEIQVHYFTKKLFSIKNKLTLEIQKDGINMLG